MDSQLKEIKQDFLIKKFCAYGFLKNLKFFEPYLLIFLMSKNISLFQIGILIALREAIINIFEIPSGFIADYFGRKKELYLCFSFYIISFIFFFYANTFAFAALAMIFFGLGEAFRSGTHKAMIYTYLDCKNWKAHKTFVYGRTRSFSLIGSAISSFIGIFLILNVTSVNYIFLFSIIPYFLDFLLILSYPNFLDYTDKKPAFDFFHMFKDFFSNFRHNNSLLKILLEEGIFEGTISFIKDLIQPILEMIIVGSGVILLAKLSPQDNLSVILGLIYAILNLFGSFASKKAYIIKGNKSNLNCLYFLHIFLALSMAMLSAFSHNGYLVFALYIIIYLLCNGRKPIFVDEVEEHIEKSQRATVLSLSSQLKSLFLMVFAPLLGFIADNMGISVVMLLLSAVFIVTSPLLKNIEK